MAETDIKVGACTDSYPAKHTTTPQREKNQGLESSSCRHSALLPYSLGQAKQFLSLLCSIPFHWISMKVTVADSITNNIQGMMVVIMKTLPLGKKGLLVFWGGLLFFVLFLILWSNIFILVP